MCGVIVVDAGRSRSTNLGRDAYILIIALDIVIIVRSSINCPTLICLPIVCYFLRESTSEIYGPRVYSLSYFLWDLLLFSFVFRSIIPKNQKYPAAFLLLILFRILSRSIYPIYTNFIPSTWHFLASFPKRDWQPLICVRLQVFVLCVQVLFT